MTDCDEVRWKFGVSGAGAISYGSASVSYTFPVSGLYTVCVKVIRTASDGTICTDKVCKVVDVFIPQPPLVWIYPNPTDGIFKAKVFVEVDAPVMVTVMDHMHRPLVQARIEQLSPVPTIELDLSGHASGMYLIRFDLADQVVVEKLLLN